MPWWIEVAIQAVVTFLLGWRDRRAAEARAEEQGRSDERARQAEAAAAAERRAAAVPPATPDQAADAADRGQF